MKNILFVTTVLAVALLAGCKPKAETTTIHGGGSAGQQLDKAQAAVKDATQQMKEYTFAQKAEFVTAMQVQLAELNRNLDDLDTTVARASDAVKTEAAPKLAALRQQSAQLAQQLASVTNATSSTWSGIKADSEKAYAALKDGLTQSRQWISDKLAP